MDYLPLRLAIYDKAFNFKGFAPAPLSLSANIRYNAASDCTFSLDANHPRVAALVTPGARAVLLYRPEGAAERTLMSGSVGEYTGEGAGFESIRTFSIRDDFNMLYELIAVPNPTGDMSEQGATGTHYRMRAPAETVFKTTVTAASARQGVPVSIAADLGRGGIISVALRMANIGEVLVPKLASSNLQIRVWQQYPETQRFIRAYIPQSYARTLTEESGIVQAASFTLAEPTATRVIVGAGGEGVNRRFDEFVDTAAEALWGVSRCVFVDARDLVVGPDDLTEAEQTEQMQDRANEALAEGAGRVGMNIELAESNAFRFGTAFDVGDSVSVQLAGAPLLTDRVREVEISWTDTDGLVVIPHIGDWDDSADAKLIDYVAKHARGIRALQRGY